VTLSPYKTEKCLASRIEQIGFDSQRCTHEACGACSECRGGVVEQAVDCALDGSEKRIFIAIGRSVPVYDPAPIVPCKESRNSSRRGRLLSPENLARLGQIHNIDLRERGGVQNEFFHGFPRFLSYS